MQTDDLLADLGAQLRDARPRRDLRPVLALAALAIAAVVALALIPRGTERRDRQAPAASTTGRPLVAVLNGTTVPGFATRTVAALRRAGYHVQNAQNWTDQAYRVTTVDAADPRFAGAADALRRRLDAGSASPGQLRNAHVLAPGAAIFVVLGYRGGSTPLARRRPRVRVYNASGRADWGTTVAGRLRARGATVTLVREMRRTRFRSHVTAVGGDAGPAAEAAADLGMSFDRGTAVLDGSRDNTVVILGSDVPGAAALERAIGLRKVTCRPATPARRRRGPFGRSRAPFYVCQSPPHRVYDVQVLRNGSFVAERRGGGKAIYGTGAQP